MLGAALKEHKRDDFVIITKVAPWNFRYDDVIRAANRSLERLGTNFIDLYMPHYPYPLTPMTGTFRAMERLVKEGKVRFIGTSNFHPIQLKMAQNSLSHEEIVANEIEYNILSRRSENRTIPYCVSQKISIVTFSPLAGGMLTGRFTSQYRPQDRPRAFNFVARNLSETEELFRVLGDIARERGSTMPQVALGWIVSHHSCIAIPASLNPQEAEENSVAGTLTLTQKEIWRINETSPSLPAATYTFDHYIIRPISWINAVMKNYIARMIRSNPV